MLKTILSSFLILSAAHVATAQRRAPRAQKRAAGAEAKRVTGEGVTGVLERYALFASKHVLPRNVDVWLPPGYAQNRRARFPVLYMHDGQNLFDPRTSFGGVDWGVDETVTRLIEQGVLRECVVVGVWNTQRRIAEYMPRKAVPFSNTKELKGVTGGTEDEIVSDEYLKFLVYELKPFIDSRYRTLRGPSDTFIMGSSMGGLVSAYAACEYPRVYGGAACVSTHWPAADGAVIDYLKTHLPRPRSHKFYFDFGTETLDAAYAPYQMRADEVMLRAGYTEGLDWVTRKFEGEEHSEKSWRKRVDIPLVFFLHK
jgi:predicted alpha/beta superfamily hydrolase